MGVLVAARIFQGLGAGTLSAVTYASVVVVYAPRDRARILALFSSAWLVPSFLGPVLGGVIATLAGWRWTFLSLAAFVPIVAVLVLPAVSRHDRGAARARPVHRSRPRGAAAAAHPSSRLDQPARQPRALWRIAFAPLAITDVRGQSVIDSGIAIAILSVAWIAAAWVHQRYAERFEFREFDPARVLRDDALAGRRVDPRRAPGAVGPDPARLDHRWLRGGRRVPGTNLFVFALARPGAEGRATSSVQLANTLGAAIGTFAMGVLLNAGTGAGFGLEGALSIVFAACLGLMGTGHRDRLGAAAGQRCQEARRGAGCGSFWRLGRRRLGRGGSVGLCRPTDPSSRGCRRRGGSAAGRRSGPR